MHVETVWIRNFRRLQDVRIDLASDISIFVGANNSGKTAAAHALQLFAAASKEAFSHRDQTYDQALVVRTEFFRGTAGYKRTVRACLAKYVI